ncbi:uncharacterized protein LAJ45_01130 [Morchella importuna]|uniref:uncharacterized protein n=1 Tax=Morchella importuna TaxID=1174673 RepID=UPI001E8EDBE5|nr:uncharacterized protein LAJ45_01130 [Morchella importuna]KAH8154602.1 hypothetical protein LAJ45_01130 [Morchella importuna]
MPSLQQSAVEVISRASLNLLSIQAHHLEFVMRNLAKNHQSRYGHFIGPNRRAYISAVAVAPEERVLPQEACVNRWGKVYEEENIFYKMMKDVEHALKSARGRIAFMMPRGAPKGTLNTTPWRIPCSGSTDFEPTMVNVRFLMDTCLLITKACDGKESDMDEQRRYITAIMNTGYNKRNQSLKECVVGATKCLAFLYRLEVRGLRAANTRGFLHPQFGKEETKNGTLKDAMERRMKRLQALEEKCLKDRSLG